MAGNKAMKGEVCEHAGCHGASAFWRMLCLLLVFIYSSSWSLASHHTFPACGTAWSTLCAPFSPTHFPVRAGTSPPTPKRSKK